MENWTDKPVWLDWEIVKEWLDLRANAPTAWLVDHSKYVDIRFDSRTGFCLVKHDVDGTFLNFK